MPSNEMRAITSSTRMGLRGRSARGPLRSCTTGRGRGVLGSSESFATSSAAKSARSESMSFGVIGPVEGPATLPAEMPVGTSRHKLREKCSKPRNFEGSRVFLASRKARESRLRQIFLA